MEGIVRDYLGNEAWREVFLLVAEMLERADEFLGLVDARIESVSSHKTIRAFFREVAKLPSSSCDLPARANKLLTGVILLSKWQAAPEASTSMARVVSQASRLATAAARVSGSGDPPLVDAELVGVPAKDAFLAALTLMLKALESEAASETNMRKRSGASAEEIAEAEARVQRDHGEERLSSGVTVAGRRYRQFWEHAKKEIDRGSEVARSGDLIHDLLQHLNGYIAATSVLLGCLEAESYVSQSLRRQMRKNLIAIEKG